MAHARLEFAGGCVASLTASRVSPEDRRRIQVFQAGSILSIDLGAKKARSFRKRTDPESKAVNLFPEEIAVPAEDALELGIIDRIIPEPVGGAHRARSAAMASAADEIAAALMPFKQMSPAEIRQQRRDKFLAIGRTLGS